MEIEETKLNPPEIFPFPFSPYGIQQDFMKNLYEVIEAKKLGIFESPTGTGKSMSLICGSLKWLLDAENRLKKDVQDKIRFLNKMLESNSLGDDWLEDHGKKARKKLERDQLHEFLEQVLHWENKIDDLKAKSKIIENKYKKYKSLKTEKKNKTEVESGKEEEKSDSDVLLDEFEEILENNTFSDSEEEQTDTTNKYSGIKVFFCSRTHSQLSQLVNEIKKSPYKDLKVRVVTLASRQNYCINESVLKLKHLTLINEKCQDLQKGREKTTKTSDKGEKIKKQKIVKGCPFKNQSSVKDLKTKILTEIEDVENIINLGKEMNGCPYYSSRSALEEAQVVIVPYSTILNKSSRKACGIDLKNSVVIIDEAHNLLDAIGNIYSCTLNGQDLLSSLNQLLQYKEKYTERLSPQNLLYLNQVVFIIRKLQKKLEWKTSVEKSNNLKEVQNVETLPEFLLSCEIDNMNFYKILKFIEKSKLAVKLQGFVEKIQPSVLVLEKKEQGVSAFLKSLSSNKKPEDQPDFGKLEENVFMKNSIFSVIDFIESLTNYCSDGRIVVKKSKKMSESFLKFLLLNPAVHFSDFVREPRSVVVAGGTMQPFSEFTDQLFFLAGASRDRIQTFTCGHIIPQENVLPVILSRGPTGKIMDFSFKWRKNLETLDELGRILSNICNVVPGGTVCFFPSYDYENFVFNYLQSTGIIDKIQRKKKVLREPKKSNEVEEVLANYSKAVKKEGAFLLSVVGGKLSEGLNFSDDLGRCVILVGLPYPNLKSPELMEKMNYLKSSLNPSAGKVYYENLCMKAVNQCIGRSVRHIKDYATVLLIDERYSRTGCIKALPGWIKKSLLQEPNFGSIIGLLSKFFSSKKNLK